MTKARYRAELSVDGVPYLVATYEVAREKYVGLRIQRSAAYSKLEETCPESALRIRWKMFLFLGKREAPGGRRLRE